MAKKKVGEMSDTLLVLGVLGVGVYFLYSKGFFSGLTGNSSNNNSTDQANQNATNQTASQQAAAGVAATLTPIGANGIASQIFTLGQTGSADDLNTIEQLLMQPNNLTDLNMVIQDFGVKSIGGAWYTLCQTLDIDCTKVDLPSFVRMIFSQGGESNLLESVNYYYSLQGINYKF